VDLNIFTQHINYLLQKFWVLEFYFDVEHKHFFCQTSPSDLRTAGPELLKWDVRPFITHKRACMPKLALQQVRGIF
jgi:hypothetical protein